MSQRSVHLPHPLRSSEPLIVYIDVKSPYAYLAIEPTRRLERTLAQRFDWRPFVLDIPSYLGSARLGEGDRVVEADRDDEQWAAVKYAYADCRRYARLQGERVRGTVKIWDTQLVSTALFWLRAQGRELFDAFLDRVYAQFWARALDVEAIASLLPLLSEVGADADAFADWARTEGLAQNLAFQNEAFALGVYGVPTYVLDGECFFGREHLPRLQWHLTGASGHAPDVAYTLSDHEFESIAAAGNRPGQVWVGVDESLDSVLALPGLKALLAGFSGEVRWLRTPREQERPEAPGDDGSRTALHRRHRLADRAVNWRRYAPPDLTPESVPAALDSLMQSLPLATLAGAPAPLRNPPMPGIVVMLDDELFIGRQHLPLLAARLNAR